MKNIFVVLFFVFLSAGLFVGGIDTCPCCEISGLRGSGFFGIAYAHDVVEKIIRVPDMDCEKCARAIEKAVSKVDRVVEVKADVDSGTCKVKMKKGTDIQKIISAIKEAGFEPEL